MISIGGDRADDIVHSYLTFSQKLVQARMAAQFLTLGVLLASAAISKMETGDSKVLVEEGDSTKPFRLGGVQHGRGDGGQSSWKEIVSVLPLTGDRQVLTLFFFRSIISELFTPRSPKERPPSNASCYP